MLSCPESPLSVEIAGNYGVRGGDRENCRWVEGVFLAHEGTKGRGVRHAAPLLVTLNLFQGLTFFASGAELRPRNKFRVTVWGRGCGVVWQCRPALVLAMPASINRQRRKTQILRQITPCRVACGHMVDLPLAVPVFQLLLPHDGSPHCREHFKQHEPLDVVFLAMPVEISVAMLVDALHKVRRHADVQRPIVEAAHDVDAGLKVEAFGHVGSKFCTAYLDVTVVFECCRE